MFLTRRERVRGALAILIFVGFDGIMLLATYGNVRNLPAYEQPATWRWFWIAWAVSAVGGGLLCLPIWLRNKTTVGDPAGMAETITRNKGRIYLVIALVFAVVGLSGVSYELFSIAAGAVGSGVLTPVLVHFTAMLGTKRGRAMIEKAVAEKIAAELDAETQDPDN